MDNTESEDTLLTTEGSPMNLTTNQGPLQKASQVMHRSMLREAQSVRLRAGLISRCTMPMPCSRLSATNSCFMMTFTTSAARFTSSPGLWLQ